MRRSNPLPEPALDPQLPFHYVEHRINCSACVSIDISDIIPFSRLVKEMEASTKPPPSNVLKKLRRIITSWRNSTDWYHYQSVTEVA